MGVQGAWAHPELGALRGGMWAEWPGRNKKSHEVFAGIRRESDSRGHRGEGDIFWVCLKGAPTDEEGRNVGGDLA